MDASWNQTLKRFYHNYLDGQKSKQTLIVITSSTIYKGCCLLCPVPIIENLAWSAFLDIFWNKCFDFKKFFNSQEQKILKKLLVDGIEPGSLWCWKQPSCQLCHNHCPQFSDILRLGSFRHDWSPSIYKNVHPRGRKFVSGYPYVVRRAE